MKHRIALALLATLATLVLSGCGSLTSGLGMLGLSTKNTVVAAATKVACTAASVAQAQQGVADSPLCKNGAASIECFAKTIAINAVFAQFCGDGSPSARESATQIDPNAQLAAIFGSAGYTPAQATMKVARLPRD